MRPSGFYSEVLLLRELELSAPVPPRLQKWILALRVIFFSTQRGSCMPMVGYLF